MTILYILSLIAAKGVKMLNYIWSGLIAVSVLCALFMGNTADISNALIESGASSIQLILTMAGIICLWSGIMKIAVESGLTNIFAKIFAPLLRPLFPRLDKKSDAFQSITMNISAMVVFVVMNTASLQLLPTTLAALRQSYGSSAPFEIIVPVWISSACALTVALLIACTLNIRQGKI